MPDKFRTRERYGEVFWRKHHEAWQQSALNQREYCEAQGIPLKAFGNWRAKFKAEPQLPTPKLLYRRRGLSHTLSHRLSHSLSHMTNDLPGPIVPPTREGHRRTFSEADTPTDRQVAGHVGQPSRLRKLRISPYPLRFSSFGSQFLYWAVNLQQYQINTH